MPPKYNPQRDTNEKEIVEALQSAGCSVQRISMQDVPDLIVGGTTTLACPHCQGQFPFTTNWFIEVKFEKGKLKPGQRTFHEDWQGQIAVAYTIEEALRIVGRT